MTTRPAESDERTIAVENESYRWAYLFLSYTLLAAAGLRAMAFDQAVWDLLALVVLAGGAATWLQAERRVLGRRWFVNGAAAIVTAALVAIMLAVFAT